MSKLDDFTIKNIDRAARFADGGGLYLAATARKDGTFSKSWLVRFTTIDGQRREMGLGSYPEISLKAARRLAVAKREEARNGADPVREKKLARQKAATAAARAVTFRECAEHYIAFQQSSWRNDKHGKQWRATLATYAYPVFGDWEVALVDTAAVTKVLDPIWTTKSETARRVRGRIESILDYATVRGHREGPNPARWRGHLSMALPQVSKAKTVKHHNALPFLQAADFMAQLRQMAGVSPRALEFTILTAARTNEVIGARWYEIDLAACTWTIAAARMKAGREHRVPLSEDAVTLLRALLPKEGAPAPMAFVFGRDGAALSNMALLTTLRRMQRPDLTTHGFRSTFRDWAAETTDFANEVVEMALAHAVGNAVEAAYRRGDLFRKRQQLMEAWAQFCRGRLAHVSAEEIAA